MQVWELKLKVYLKKNILMEDSQTEISKIIDNCLTKDEELLNFHNSNEFKNYTFSMFFPIEKGKVYQAGMIYTVTIRTVEEKLVKHFKKYLEDESSTTIKALTLGIRTIPKKYIEKIYSITPVIAKFDNGYWRTNESVEVFEERLKNNIIKKYNKYTNQKIDEEFDLFTFIKFENTKPISVKYKNIKLLGDKLTLNVAENDMAQEIAYFAIGVGLLEINGRGCGFMNYKWL